MYLCALCCALVGCQSYEPKPLDLSSHADTWRTRSAGDDAVRAFADQLANTSDSQAESFNPDDGLSLAEGEVVALVFNPDLRLARLRAEVSRAEAEHAGLWDDPEFAIDVLKITEGVPDPWVVGSAISFTVPLSGRLAVEKARANASLHAELDRIAEAEWQTRRDLREAWYEWSALQLQVKQVEHLLRSLDGIIESAGKLTEAGELNRTEAALFTIEQVSRREALSQLQGERLETEHRIRALLGLSPDAPVNLLPSLASVQPADDEPQPQDTNLTLARLRREYEVAEQALHREVRKQYPDLMIGPQYESDAGQSRVGFVGAIPLPILNANKGGIAAARAEREVARAAYETEYEKTIGRLAVLNTRLNTLHKQREAIDTTLVPLIDKQVSDAKRLLDLGEGGSLVLLESLVRAHDAKLQLIGVQQQIAQTTKEIRFLVGPPAATTDTKATEVTP